MKQEIITQDMEIGSYGQIFLENLNQDGTKSKSIVKNKVLLSGRSALAKILANDYTGPFQFYIARVLFGNSGTLGGSPRLVDDGRTGLFGPVTLAKPVIAAVDDTLPQQVTFTTTVAFTDLVGDVINEMALEMANGDLFSMATFGDISKTSGMQLTFNWRLNWI